MKTYSYLDDHHDWESSSRVWQEYDKESQKEPDDDGDRVEKQAPLRLLGELVEKSGVSHIHLLVIESVLENLEVFDEHHGNNRENKHLTGKCGNKSSLVSGIL
jgi:hypothetical protein